MKKTNIFADMKRIIPIVLLSAVAVVLSVSCSTEVSPENFFSTTNTELTYKGGVAEFTIYSNGKWTAEWTDEGVSVIPVNGYGDTKVSVTVPENYLYSDYPVRITFVTSIDSTSYTGKSVVTLHAAPFVICEDRARFIGPEASIQRFYVNSNHPWSVRSRRCNGEAWDGEVTPSSGIENGVWVSVTVPENMEAVEKDYEIEIALDDFPEADPLLLHFLQVAPEQGSDSSDEGE